MHTSRVRTDELEAVINAAPLGIYVVDESFRLSDANPVALAVFGAAHCWLGRDFAELIHSLWPRDYADTLLARFRHTLDTGAPYVHDEHTDRRIDRDQVEHYEWQIRRIGLAGGRHGVVCYFREISQRVATLRELERQREALRFGKERLELAQQTTGVGTYDWDMVANTSEVSPEWRRHYGIPEAAPMPTHEDWQRCIHPDDRETASAAALEAAKSGAPFEREYRVVWPDGSVHWVASGGRTFFDPSGRPVRMLGTALDITARKLAIVDLAAAKSAAEAASRAKDDFLAVLSHELRTPLTPVLATAELLDADDTLSAGHRRMVKMIRRNVELEARLIDDLLDVTRITQSKVELQIATIDVHEIVTRVIDICRADARAGDIRIDTLLNARDCFVEADSARLQQIIWNLLKNAIKFTPAQGRVTISTENGAAGRLAVRVADTGIGIDPALRAHIFNAFEQGSRSVTQKFGGLGLGLAISKALAHLHGGSISVTSAGANQGSTFSLELTTSVRRAPEPPEVQTPATGRLACAVLLVEDHADTRAIMEFVLEEFGCRIRSTDGVAGALQIAGEQAFDLVVSDLGLPDGSGTDLMRELKARYGLKGIALTGYGMDSDRARTREAGFDAHLVKPVNLELLEATVRRLTAPGSKRM